jgi:hypothetical protein
VSRCAPSIGRQCRFHNLLTRSLLRSTTLSFASKKEGKKSILFT